MPTRSKKQGFGYQFDSLHNFNNELAVAFHNVLNSNTNFDVLSVISDFLGFLDFLASLFLCFNLSRSTLI